MSPHTTRRSFTDLLLLRTPITLTPIRGTTPGWGWRGVPQDLRLVLGPAATGAIAIGAMATSTSTTIITSTETPTGTSTVVKLARATGGSTTRNTGEMHPMGTGKQRINSAVRVLLIALAVEPEHAQVVAELAHDPAAERELGPGVAGLELQVVAEPELELAPVVAVAVPGHQRARLAVAPRTKSVTAAHRPDLVPLLEAEEDLAAVVAETTREPVAAEAVIAWAAAE